MNLSIDHSSKKPLHVQTEELLLKLISQTEYKNGKLLPNEIELSKQLNISRNTLRQAINKLVFEGRLVRKKGYGTKVAKQGIVGGVKNWLSFSQEMRNLGIEIKNFELHITRQTPNEKIANFFEGDKPAGKEAIRKCLVLERVRGNVDFPFVYFISYFNPEIPISDEENFSKPLYEILENKYGVVVKTSKEEVFARLAGENIAKKLDIKAHDPILVRRRYVYDDQGKPVEYNVGYYRADSFTYTISAER